MRLFGLQSMSLSCVVALVIFACSASIANGQGLNSDSLRERLLDEGPQAWRECVEYYDRLQVDLTYDIYDTSKGTVAFTVVEQARHNGDSFYFQTTRTGSAAERYRLFATNPLYSFILEKKEVDAQWAMIDGANDPEGIRKSSRPLADRKPMYFQAPIWVSQFISLLELVNSPCCRITEVVPEMMQGRLLCRFSYVLELNGVSGNELLPEMLNDVSINNALFGSFLPRKGTILVDPDHFWVIVEHEAEAFVPASDRVKYARISKTRRHDYDFGVPSGDVPKIQGITDFLTYERRDGKLEYKDALYTRWKYTLLQQTMAPDEFRLTAFGLPELDFLASQEVERNGSISWWLILFLSAIVVAAVAFLFQRSQRRTRA
jgi:hypothetical protein